MWYHHRNIHHNPRGIIFVESKRATKSCSAQAKCICKDYTARVEGEYSGGSTTLTYGYIDLNKFQSAKIRLGQFKPSYGLERAMSTSFTDFQERSLADVLLGRTFDRGVMVYGSPFTGLTILLMSMGQAQSMKIMPRMIAKTLLPVSRVTLPKLCIGKTL